MKADILNVISDAHRALDTVVSILEVSHAAYWTDDAYHLRKIKGMIGRLEANVQAIKLDFEAIMTTPGDDNE